MLRDNFPEMHVANCCGNGVNKNHLAAMSRQDKTQAARTKAQPKASN
jgi:hypothetical protein